MRSHSLTLLALLGSTTLALSFPDLEDSGASEHVISSTQVARGGTFAFSTFILNKGDQDALDVPVTFRLSTDQIAGDADDQILGTVMIRELFAGEEVEVSATLQMPQRSTAPAPYWLVWTFGIPRDENPGNNSGIYLGSQISTGPTLPDFDLLGGNAVFNNLNKSTVRGGESFLASTNVCNAGPHASAAYSVQFRLSKDAIIGDGDDYIIGEFGYGGLGAPFRDPTCELIVERLTIPLDQPQSTYRFGYTIQSALDIDPSNNAVLFDDPLTVTAQPATGIDLTDAGSSYWSVSPQFVQQGVHVTIQTAVQNIGTEAPQTAIETGISFIASTNLILGDSDDIDLGNTGLQPIQPGVTNLGLVTRSPSTDLLTPGGAYFIGWVIDGDDITTNNSGIIPSPIFVFESIDFALSEWRIEGDTYDPGAHPLFVGLVQNTGDVEFQPELRFDYYRRSLFGTTLVDPGKERVGLEAITDILHPGGERQLQVRDQQESLEPGTYEVVVRGGYLSGGEFIETDSYPIAEDLIVLDGADLPDLEPVDVAISSTTIAPGQSFTVSGRVENKGAYYTGTSVLRVMLGGVTIASAPIAGGLENNAARAFSLSITIPGSIPPAGYTLELIADADDTIQERDESNNTHEIEPFLYGNFADLRESEGFRAHPAAVLAGQPFEFDFRLINFGWGNAVGVTVDYYLSSDTGINPLADTLIGSAYLGSLASLQSIDLSTSLVVPGGSSGNYYIGVVIDKDGRVTEVNESNNTFRTELPVYVGARANLTPGNTPAAVSSPEVEAGGTFVFTGSRKNTGSIAAGGHHNHLVLSPASPVSLIEDVVLAEFVFAGREALAGTSYSVNSSVSIPPTTAPGFYFVRYVQDAGNAVHETSEHDNAASALISVAASNEPPRFIDGRRSPNNLYLHWTSRADRRYQLYISRHMRVWLPVGLPIDGREQSTAHDFSYFRNDSPVREFYRITEVPE